MSPFDVKINRLSKWNTKHPGHPDGSLDHIGDVAVMPIQLYGSSLNIKSAGNEVTDDRSRNIFLAPTELLR